jgi:hypothetical protein
MSGPTIAGLVVLVLGLVLLTVLVLIADKQRKGGR